MGLRLQKANDDKVAWKASSFLVTLCPPGDQGQPDQETGCASHALPPCFLLIDKDEICSDLLEGEGGVLSYVTGVVVPLPFSVCVEYIYHVSRGGLGMKYIMVPICKRTTNCRYCFPISLYVYVPIWSIFAGFLSWISAAESLQNVPQVKLI